MGQKSKIAKGEISISDCEGRIRLRWRFLGERYSLNLPFAYTEDNLHHANVKIAEIKLDILKGCFDTSLKKYKPESKIQPVKNVSKLSGVHVQDNRPVFLSDLVQKFNDWTRNIRNVDVENSVDYLYLRKLLEKWVGVPINEVAEKLNTQNWAASTYNKRLSYLSSFFTWLLSLDILKSNPLQDVLKRRNKGKKKSIKRKPLEESEILILLDAIKENRFCPSSSRFKHSHYYPFLKFMFYTGVRNAEAIGLRVKHLDFQAEQVEISETLARTVKGSNHASRVRKGTKMENVRYLPLNLELKTLLMEQVQGKNLEDLVFQSVTGLSIDDRMFERRILKPVLEKLGLGDRDLYASRHSFGTRAVQQGMSLTDVAYLMGHTSIETASRNYVHVTRQAKALPRIN